MKKYELGTGALYCTFFINNETILLHPNLIGITKGQRKRTVQIALKKDEKDNSLSLLPGFKYAL